MNNKRPHRPCRPLPSRAAALTTALGVALLSSVSCARPSSSTQVSEDAPGSPVHLSLGATAAQAREGRTSSFVLERTPDPTLHAELRDSAYEGKTLQIRGTDSRGEVAWSYDHVQKGESFDAVLPVFGSAVARKHATGPYAFEVRAPDRHLVATGKATFTSSASSPSEGRRE